MGFLPKKERKKERKGSLRQLVKNLQFASNPLLLSKEGIKLQVHLNLVLFFSKNTKKREGHVTISNRSILKTLGKRTKNGSAVGHCRSFWERWGRQEDPLKRWRFRKGAVGYSPSRSLKYWSICWGPVRRWSSLRDGSSAIMSVKSTWGHTRKRRKNGRKWKKMEMGKEKKKKKEKKRKKKKRLVFDESTNQE